MRDFQRACQRYALRLRLVWDKPPEMFPTSGGPPSTWSIPAIVTASGLADWLDVTTSHLDWFADRRGAAAATGTGRLPHYRYHWLAKRVGGSARLIEAPKWRLKTIQQRILHGILDLIPPHETGHGFRQHRSIRSYVAAASRPGRGGADRLARLFSVDRSGRVNGLVSKPPGIRTEVAALLAALCTNQVPDDVWQDFPQYGSTEDRWYHERLYREPHLPQGAPTSPALANLIAYRLDCRLQGLAAAAGASVYALRGRPAVFGRQRICRAGPPLPAPRLVDR